MKYLDHWMNNKNFFLRMSFYFLLLYIPLSLFIYNLFVDFDKANQEYYLSESILVYSLIGALLSTLNSYHIDNKHKVR